MKTEKSQKKKTTSEERKIIRVSQFRVHCFESSLNYSTTVIFFAEEKGFNRCHFRLYFYAIRFAVLLFCWSPSKVVWFFVSFLFSFRFFVSAVLFIFFGYLFFFSRAVSSVPAAIADHFWFCFVRILFRFTLHLFGARSVRPWQRFISKK